MAVGGRLSRTERGEVSDTVVEQIAIKEELVEVLQLLLQASIHGRLAEQMLDFAGSLF